MWQKLINFPPLSTQGFVRTEYQNITKEMIAHYAWPKNDKTKTTILIWPVRMFATCQTMCHCFIFQCGVVVEFRHLPFPSSRLQLPHYYVQLKTKLNRKYNLFKLVIQKHSANFILLPCGAFLVWEQARVLVSLQIRSTISRVCINIKY